MTEYPIRQIRPSKIPLATGFLGVIKYVDGNKKISYDVEVENDDSHILQTIISHKTANRDRHRPQPDSSKKNTKGEKVEKFAVIDTETNWNDQVMSIGIIIADGRTKEKIASKYYIITPEYKVGGMYASELESSEKEARVTDRKQALEELRQWMDSYQVRKLFAYNASFDKRHLPEYSKYRWYDIMRLAAYRQYNKAIPASAECCQTGRLKRGYGVEDILQMFSRNNSYRETHNAVTDAEDELKIMKLLGYGINEYAIALI